MVSPTGMPIMDRITTDLLQNGVSKPLKKWEEGNWGAEFRLERGIYGSSPETLLNLLRNLPGDNNIACLVGHEPTFSSFITMSTDSGWIRFPTASMARIDFDVLRWQDVRFGEGTLAWLMRPKELD